MGELLDGSKCVWKGHSKDFKDLNAEDLKDVRYREEVEEYTRRMQEYVMERPMILKNLEDLRNKMRSDNWEDIWENKKKKLQAELKIIGFTEYTIFTTKPCSRCEKPIHYTIRDCPGVKCIYCGFTFCWACGRDLSPRLCKDRDGYAGSRGKKNTDGCRPKYEAEERFAANFEDLRMFK